MPTDPSPDILRVADLPNRAPTAFSLKPGAAATEALRDDLDLIALRKLRFEGRVEPAGKKDWRLTGRLGATVVQPCVATLAPVTTRIEAAVERLFQADFKVPDEPEAEMPEDDSTEPLGAEIDLAAIMAEALSLALPLYPRAEGAPPVAAAVTEPGKEPMSDDDAKPFAKLAALKKSPPDDAT